MKTNIFNALKVSALALILSFGMSYALAWTAPLSAPPAGNVSAPLNTSTTTQTKAGGLVVGSLNAGAGTIQTTGFLSGQILTNSITFADLTTMTTAPAASISHGKQRFTTSGTWTAPAGVTTVWVSMSGGGGGGAGGGKYGCGGGCIRNIFGGGGGGAGAVFSQPVVVVPGTLYPVTVGAGGVGGIYQTSGTPGGQSSFGSLVVANGGGVGTTSLAGSTGGAAGGGGGSSLWAVNIAGAGGDSIFGAGGEGAVYGLSTAGFPGAGYGAGGGGGGYSATTAGGAGAPGFVLVEW